MNTKRESKLKMFLTVRIYLLLNPAITANLPNFLEFLTALDLAILQIQTNAELLQYSSKGVTDNKKLMKDTLIMITADQSRKIQAYAKYENNTVLLAETKFTETSLKPLSEIELLNTSNGLYNRIETNVALVILYGISFESQTNFLNAINAYTEAIPQTRQNQLSKKENTLLESQGYELGDTAYSNIDSVVEIVRLTETTFYAGYKNARKIVEYGTNTLQAQGQINDAVTQLPIMNASLVFKLSGQSEITLEKQTALKGGFMIKSLPEGIYEVTISKIGYQTKTVTATVSRDILCDVNEELMKL